MPSISKALLEPKPCQNQCRHMTSLGHNNLVRAMNITGRNTIRIETVQLGINVFILLHVVIWLSKTYKGVYGQNNLGESPHPPGSGQLVPKTTRTQDNSYPSQLVPKTTRTQDNSYPRQLVTTTTRTQDNSYPGQIVPRTTRTHVVWYHIYVIRYHTIRYHIMSYDHYMMSYHIIA